MGVKITGADDLIRKLEKAGKLDAIKQVVKADGGTLQARAQTYVPVDTGTLKRNIVLEIIDNGLTAKSEARTDYADYVEHGTRKMEAQPYMKPAYEQTVEEFKSHIKRVME